MNQQTLSMYFKNDAANQNVPPYIDCENIDCLELDHSLFILLFLDQTLPEITPEILSVSLQKQHIAN